MNSLLRGMKSTFGGHDTAVKNSLITQLSACVKDLQVEQADPGTREQVSTEVTSGLCTVLEAMFIHGLKDSFLQRVSQAVRSELDSRPDPNFWGPLLVVSHRDVIDQLMKLNLVQTDVGRCRAWIRLALNDCLLSRYLETVRREGQSALSHYYRRGAMLRDVELLDVAQRLLEGIESYPIALPLNSSLLDTWTVQPLLQAGLWTPPMRATNAQESVALATEVLEKEEEESLAIDTLSIASLSSFQSSFMGQMLKVNEEEALKRILGTPVDETPISARQRAEETAAECREGEQEKTVLEVSASGQSEKRKTELAEVSEMKETVEKDDSVSPGGNSLAGRLGWSSSFEETKSGVNSQIKVNSAKTNRKLGPANNSMLQSYHSLLESYNIGTSTSLELPDLNDFLQQFEPGTSSSSTAPSSNGRPDLAYPEGLGYEVIDNSPSSCRVPDFGSLLQQVTKLPQELGLDAQKYVCFGCPNQIGLNFNPARVCGFTGQYFCVECMVGPGEEWIVPARILYNWDFRRFCISRSAATFLSEIQHHPLLNLKVINPCLYLAVEEVHELQKVRNELNLLRAYLFTCREPVIEELQKLVWPREYLYEHVHLYSVSDLLQIPSGALAQLLNQVVAFARNHVLSCWLCSQKGFFCEVCKDPNIIYPFDTATTFRCPGCSSVFHASCRSADRPCPKCERRRQRGDICLPEAAVESC